MKQRPAIYGWVPGAKLECIEGKHKGSIVELIILEMGNSASNDFIVVKYKDGKEGVEHPNYYQVVSHVTIEPATSLNFMK